MERFYFVICDALYALVLLTFCVCVSFVIGLSAAAAPKMPRQLPSTTGILYWPSNSANINAQFTALHYRMCNIIINHLRWLWYCVRMLVVGLRTEWSVDEINVLIMWWLPTIRAPQLFQFGRCEPPPEHRVSVGVLSTGNEEKCTAQTQPPTTPFGRSECIAQNARVHAHKHRTMYRAHRMINMVCETCKMFVFNFIYRNAAWPV